MAELDPILVAVPFFFALIGLELAVAHARGRTVYRFPIAVADLASGIGQQATNIFTRLVELVAYTWVYEHLRLLTWEGWSAWVGGFLLVDLTFYLWHRTSHRVNVMWAAHGVHHQSQDYNLAVALRQEWLSFPFKLPFHLPLALIGLHPIVFLTCSALNTLYQFWIHTELIGKLGPLEWVMNTPSHHRVHHGVNPAYIDRNHAGVFIVWDRLFGTFKEEDEAPVYGTVEPFESVNSAWAQVALFSKIIEVGRSSPRWSDRLGVWVRPPEWRPEGAVTIPAVDATTFVKWKVDAPFGTKTYVALWFVPTLAAVVLMLAFPEAPVFPRTVGVVLVLWTIATWGGLLEGRAWARPVEWTRLLACVAASVLVADYALMFATVAVGVLSLSWWATGRVGSG